MYTTMVRPIVTYGAVVWSDRVKLKTAQLELDKVQRLACAGNGGNENLSYSRARSSVRIQAVALGGKNQSFRVNG